MKEVRAVNLRFLTLVLLTATFACCQDKPKDSASTPNQSVTPKEFEKAVSVITTTQSQNQQKTQEAIKAVNEDAMQIVQIQKKEEETKKILDVAKQQTEEDLKRAQRRNPASEDELKELRSSIEIFQKNMKHEAKVNSILSWLLLGTALALGLASFVCSLNSHGTASAICTFLVGLVLSINKYAEFDTQAHLYGALEGQAAQLRRSVQPQNLLQGQYLDANETLGTLGRAEHGADKGSIDETIQSITSKPTSAAH